MIEMNESFDIVNFVGANPFRYLGLPSNATYEQIQEARNTVPGMFAFGEDTWPYDFKGYEVLDRSEASINNACMEIEKNHFLHAMFFPIEENSFLFAYRWNSLGKIYRNPEVKDPVDAYDFFLVASLGYAISEDLEEEKFLLGSDGTPRARMLYEYLPYAFDEQVIRQVAAKRGFQEVSTEMLAEYRNKLTRYMSAFFTLRTINIVNLLFTDEQFAKIYVKYSRDVLREYVSILLQKGIESTSKKIMRPRNNEILKSCFPPLIEMAGLLDSSAEEGDIQIKKIYNEVDDFLAWLFERSENKEEAVSILELCLHSKRACDLLGDYYFKQNEIEKSRAYSRRGVRLGNQKCFRDGLYSYIMDTDEDCTAYLNQMMDFDFEYSCFLKGLDEEFRKKNYIFAQAFYKKVSESTMPYIKNSIARALDSAGRSGEAVYYVQSYIKNERFKSDTSYAAQLGCIMIRGGAYIPGLVLIGHSLQKKYKMSEYRIEELKTTLARIDITFNENELRMRPSTEQAKNLLGIAEQMELEDYYLSASEMVDKYKRKLDNNESWADCLYLNALMHMLLTGCLGDFNSYSNCIYDVYQLFKKYEYLNTLSFISRDEIITLGKTVEKLLDETETANRIKLISEFAKLLANISYPEMKVATHIYGSAIGAIYTCVDGTFDRTMPYVLSIREENMPAEAIEMLSCLAQLNIAISASNLAWAYFYGRGITRDINEAIKLFNKAAESGENTAMNALGLIYLLGEEVEKDEEKGMYWKRRAAYFGNSQAREEFKKYGMSF